MRWKPAIFFAAVGLVAVAVILNTEPPIGVGSQAPDFELKDGDGEIVRLSDFRGKLVFLNFWATWCKPCIEEMPDMMTMNKAFEGKPFQMLAVSADTQWSAVEDFYEKYELDLPTLHDPAQQIARGRYKVTGYPETFLIDGNGYIISKHWVEAWSSPQWMSQMERLIEERALATDATSD